MFGTVMLLVYVVVMIFWLQASGFKPVLAFNFTLLVVWLSFGILPGRIAFCLSWAVGLVLFFLIKEGE